MPFGQASPYVERSDLVSQTALVNGEAGIYDVLQDPSLAHILSDEGPLPRILEIWARERL